MKESMIRIPPLPAKLLNHAGSCNVSVRSCSTISMSDRIRILKKSDWIEHIHDEFLNYSARSSPPLPPSPPKKRRQTASKVSWVQHRIRRTLSNREHVQKHRNSEKASPAACIGGWGEVDKLL